MSEEVVVKGATGFLGRAVVEQLLGGGWKVIGLSRTPDEARRTQPRITWLTLGSEDARRAIERAGRVVNLAGAHPFERRWSPAYKKIIRESRIGTTTQVADALARSTAAERVLVNASGIWVYGDRGEDEIVDDAPLDGAGFLPDMIRDWESAARAAEAAGARVAIMRIGLAFGHGGGPLSEIEPNFRRFMGGHAGDGKQFVPWLHVDDQVAMITTALNDARWSGAYIGAAPGAIRFRELASQIGGALGRPSWFHPPAPVLGLMIGEASTLLLESYRARPARAQAHGFRFKYETFESAIHELYRRAA